MASESFYLSITPVTLDSIPSVETILKVARPLIQESESWAPSGTFEHKKPIQTSVHIVRRPKGPKDGASWYGRASEHTKDHGTWDDFWAGLGVNHSEHEAEYYPELHRVTCLERISPEQEIWTLHYALRPPISHRVFTVVITTHIERDETTGLTTGYIVSLPIDVSSNPEYSKKEEPVTRGRYVSVERIQETADGGVSWRMITSSTPGGAIPQWVAERSMPGKIQEDVPGYIKWMHKHREEAEKGSGTVTA